MNEQLAVVILSYGNGPAGDLCGRLIEGGGEASNIIVVENPHPSGRSCEFPAGVTVLRAPSNEGYGSGMNRGLEFLSRRSVSTVVMLTHDVDVDWATCKELARRREVTGWTVCAPILHRPDGAVVSAGGDMTRLFGVRHRPAPINSPPDWLDGACLGALPSVRFREDLFMYWEDVELGMRVRRQGGSLGVARDLQAWTTPSPSASPEVFRFYSWRNRLIVLHDNPIQLAVSCLALIATGILRCVQPATQRKVGRSQLLRTYVGALVDGLKQRGGRRISRPAAS